MSVVKEFNFLSVPNSIFDEDTFFKTFFNFLHASLFILKFFIFLGSFDLTGKTFEYFFKTLEIFGDKFSVNNFNISNWVNFSFFVNNFFIWESSDNMEDSINSRDVRQESVT